MTNIDLGQYIAEIQNVKSNKELKSVTESALYVIGFSKWVYASDNPYSRLNFPATLSCGYSSVWIMTYIHKRYQMIDPIVLHCRTHTEPIFWDAVDGWESADQKLKNFMADVRKNGFVSGVAFALTSPEGVRGIFNVVSEQPLYIERDRYEKALPDLIRVGQAVHLKTIAFLNQPSFLNELVDLSGKES